MNSNIDNLIVPRIDNLGEMSTDGIINALDDNGVRHPIDNIDYKEFPYHPLTTFSMAHSDDMLYIDFFVRCNYLRAINDRPNTPVHEDSCVAVYLQPDNKSNRYYAFEINCIGTISGMICEGDGDNACSFIDESTIGRIKCYASCGNRPFRELEGLFTWNVLIAIPLDMLGLKYDGTPLTIKGNFYKCASGTSQPHFLSWMPLDTTKRTFHQPESFGNIILS